MRAIVMIKHTAITLLGAAAFTMSAQAEIEFELAAGAHSHYVWRGADQGGGQLIDTSLTASTEVNGFDVSANVWYATTGNGGVDEVDFTLAAEKDFGFSTVSFGAIYYSFPDNSNAPQAAELFLGFANTFNGVDVSFDIYKNVYVKNDAPAIEEGTYLELGLSKSIDAGAVTPTLDFAVGYSVKIEEITHYQFGISTEHTVSENATVSPYLTYSIGEADGFRDEFFGGVSVALSF